MGAPNLLLAGRHLTSLRPWGHGLFGLILAAPLSAVCLYSYTDYKITNFGCVQVPLKRRIVMFI